MGQHAKRFNAVNAQKGTGLRSIADQLKTIADTAEDWFDPNSPEVVRAMQRFEQGLAALALAPPRPATEEVAEKSPASRRRKSTVDTPVSASAVVEEPES